MIPVKICGLSTPDTLDAAVQGGAAFVGFVFYPPSPRAISPAQAASLAARVPPGVRSVGLFVDPDDAALDAAFDAFAPDMIQLHGRETPARVQAIRSRFTRPVIKALRVSGPEDVSGAAHYHAAADWLLFDAAPAGATLPGGTGEAFDWSLLAGYRGPIPWMLSGGLNIDTIPLALERLAPHALDLSSGVEDRPGCKSVEKIAALFDSIARLTGRRATC